jgi:hypothetical protein
MHAKSLFTSEPLTKRFELASTTVFGPGSSYTGEAVATAGSDEEQAAAGATGTAPWSLPIAERWAAQTVAIRPAGGDGGGTDEEDCAKALAEIIRKILEGIVNAINSALKKGSAAAKKGTAAAKERRAKRKGDAEG